MAHAQDVPLPQDAIHVDLSGIQSSIEQGLVRGLSELGDRLTVNNYIAKANTFDGNSSEKMRLWFRDVDRIFQDTKNDKIALSAASLLLTGPASSFFATRRGHVDTWAQMKEDFKAFYANLWDPDLLEEKLSNFSQHTNENVQGFYDRIKRTASDVYGQDINNPLIQRQLIKVYKNGLCDKRIRNKLYRTNPQTIEQALEIAMEENKILRHIDQNDRPEPMEVDAVRMASDPLEKKVEKLTEMVNVLLVEHKNAVHQNVQSQQSQHYQQAPTAQYTRRPQTNRRPHRNPADTPRRDTHETPTYRFTEDGRPICYFCDTPGHIQRHCRKAKRQEN